jgi:hypothetical protein
MAAEKGMHLRRIHDTAHPIKGISKETKLLLAYPNLRPLRRELEKLHLYPLTGVKKTAALPGLIK